MKQAHGKPIWDAYADIPDLAAPCPNCGAVDTWCTKPDGRVSRVPCIARLTTHVLRQSENVAAPNP